MGGLKAGRSSGSDELDSKRVGGDLTLPVAALRGEGTRG
jgi:hypothetical protein